MGEVVEFPARTVAAPRARSPDRSDSRHAVPDGTGGGRGAIARIARAAGAGSALWFGGATLQGFLRTSGVMAGLHRGEQ